VRDDQALSGRGLGEAAEDEDGVGAGAVARAVRLVRVEEQQPTARQHRAHCPCSVHSLVQQAAAALHWRSGCECAGLRGGNGGGKLRTTRDPTARCQIFATAAATRERGTRLGARAEGSERRRTSRRSKSVRVLSSIGSPLRYRRHK
jgi:hypothetical protein